MFNWLKNLIDNSRHQIMTGNISNGIANFGDHNVINNGVPAELVSQIVTALSNKYPDAQSNDALNALTAAVTALSQGKGVSGSESQIKAAMEALAQGDTTQAKDLFKLETQRVELAAKQGAEAYRNLGALAFLDNTQEALTAYRRATELDQDNAAGWTWLGILLRRVGELDEVITAYSKVLALGESHQDQQEIAMAYGNLGLVYYTRGDLDKAIEFYQKSLAITEALGMKETSANQYGNLGNVYYTRGDLDKAIEFYQKGLVIEESLGLKEGMAAKYGNLGAVYEQKGNKAEAKRYWQKSLELYKYLKSPNAKTVQGWLESLH